MKCRPHLELDPALKSRAEKGGVFLYAALHKSLWETTGIQVALTLSGLDVPWVGMGDNLVHGRFFQGLVERAGGFLIRRPRNRRDLIASARQLRDSVISLLKTERSVLVFPEGTRRGVPDNHRHGPFFPAVFEAVLQYARERSLAGGEKYPPVFIVPVNVDYARIREDREMIHRRGGPLTLHILDSMKMISHVGDVFLSFGTPMEVSQMMELDRRSLAEITRDACLDLVKILPVNVAAHGILRATDNGRIDRSGIAAGIAQTLNEVRPHAHRMRGFSLSDDPEKLLAKASRMNHLFRETSERMLPVVRLYADYIGHLIH